MPDPRASHNTRPPRVTPIFLLLFGAALPGCGWEQPKAVPAERYDSSQSTIVHIAPKDLVKRLQEQLPGPPMSIPVESVQDGTVVTGYKEYEGAVHIVRRWRERTRFKITVLPDFNEPLSTSHVQIFEETEEKPSDPQPWYPNPDVRRPERAAEVLRFIEHLHAH